MNAQTLRSIAPPLAISTEARANNPSNATIATVRLKSFFFMFNNFAVVLPVRVGGHGFYYLPLFYITKIQHFSLFCKYLTDYFSDT